MQLYWDTFDAMLTGIHGRPSIHLAAGSMVQETTGELDMAEGSFRVYLQRTKERCLATDAPVSLPPFHVGTKWGPRMVVQQVEHPEINIILETTMSHQSEDEQSDHGDTWEDDSDISEFETDEVDILCDTLQY